MRRLQSSMLVRALVALVVAMGFVATGAAQQRREPVVVEWPNRDFPALQNAIDALNDGDTLRIAAGVFPISEPLFVRGKRVLIEGAGCDELRRDGSKNTKFTHLVGPRVERVVAASDAVALINEPGGTLRDLKLSGFDAGIRGFSLENRPSSALNITDVCISDTGRGIVWSAPALLSGENVRIHDVRWTGVSVFLPLPPPLPLSPAVALDWIQFTGLDVFNAAYACLVYKNALASVTAALSHCGTAGILAVKSLVEIKGTTIVSTHFGPGIATSEGVILFDGFVNSVEGAVGYGVLLHNPFAAQLKRLLVKDIQPRSDGLFGDGVVVFGAVTSGPVQVEHSIIRNTARAGLANFGSFVSLKDTKISCTAFDLNGEDSFQFLNLGGNLCGCPEATGSCVAESSSLQPPDPITEPIP